MAGLVSPQDARSKDKSDMRKLAQQAAQRSTGVPTSRQGPGKRPVVGKTGGTKKGGKK
jgi:hypothetical protein